MLAECVDARTGRRFKAGETFAPAPTIDQAKRLIAGGCLAEAALKAAVEPEVSAKLISAGPKLDSKTASADIDQLRKSVDDARLAAETEIKAITAGVDRARADAEKQLDEIGTEIAAARAKAITAKAEFAAEVENARKQADADIATITADVEKARDAAKKTTDKKD
ncbi:hypothetical protein [Sinorhizobium meliloti]|uniref:hypothetical protein n=1 Tax=Rhizobium meliloti TaxID=382 RepID=UPI00129659F3|nr:hypothetical protein [Sinorhizobium meliloti]MDE3854875.1 hypothetical protein [Sinorhizobium meliloti]MQW52550.1 hypothetical protein [Sinorhizobium meliloti]